MGDAQSLHFWFNFDPRFSLKIAKIEKNKYLRKNFTHRAIQISPNQGSISSCLSTKNTITFCPILAIFGRKLAKIKGQRVRIKIWNSLFYQHGSWASSSQTSLVPPLSSFAAMSAKIFPVPRPNF